MGAEQSIDIGNSSFHAVHPFVGVDENSSNYPPGVKVLEFENDSERREIPIFNLRDEAHHDLIAQNYATFKTGVVFGIGVYGVTGAVEYPTVGKHLDTASAFRKVKPDRSFLDKIPLHIHPKDLPRIMDMSSVHPQFKQYLEDREKRETFYKAGVAIHLIVPVKEDFPYLDQVFVTQPEDWAEKKAPKDQWQKTPTVAAFWWDDPDLERIYLKTQRLNPWIMTGISSFNDSHEEPAWDEQGVYRYLQEKGRCPFDFMVSDPKTEKMGVKSSHPQLAIPLKGEEPIWKVYRTGATDIDKFMARMGSNHPYRLVEGSKQAARAYPQDKNLDSLVMEAHKAVTLGWQERHPKKNGFAAFMEKLI